MSSRSTVITPIGERFTSSQCHGNSWFIFHWLFASPILQAICNSSLFAFLQWFCPFPSPGLLYIAFISLAGKIEL